MAEVFRAEQTRAEGNRIVAFKRLLHASDLEHHQRFREELRILARCTHPYIVPVLDYGTMEE